MSKRQGSRAGVAFRAGRAVGSDPEWSHAIRSFSCRIEDRLHLKRCEGAVIAFPFRLEASRIAIVRWVGFFLWFGVFALALTVNSTAADGGETVRFESPSIPPSPFKVKRAKAKGLTAKSKPGIELTGILFRPESKNSNAAVVILVSGDGLQKSHLAWGESLADGGYTALVVDSFGSRGGTNYRDTKSVDVFSDARAAFSFLRGLPEVGAGKIAVMGFSLGGSRLFTIFDASRKRPSEADFSAGIAFYPMCAPDKPLTAPILILGGDSDPQMSLEGCRTAVAQAGRLGNKLTMKIYRGATHFFDNPDYKKDSGAHPKSGTLPLWFADNHYDEQAHGDALVRVREFLDQHLR